MYEIEGKFLKIQNEKSTDKYSLVEFVIVTNSKKNNEISITGFGDVVQSVNGLKQGDEVKVSFYVSGKEYNGRYYVSLIADSVMLIGSQNTVTSDKDDDLPF